MVAKRGKVKEGNGDAPESPSLGALREKIDRIDDRILSLLSERQEAASGIGKIKSDRGLKILDAAREQEILERLTSKSEPRLSAGAIRNIFREIFSAARSIQEVPPVAYLGPEATFCHQAAMSHFGRSTALRAAETMEEIFSLVEKGSCGRGVVPVENSYEGSVSTTLDLLFRYDLKIEGEIFLRIRHLFLVKEKDGGDIRHIYSHPMALAQCRAWLKSRLPHVTVRETESTSAAARQIIGEPGAAAIGSRLSAAIYGLSVMEEDIEDHPGNVTRFLVVGKGVQAASGKDKTSFLFSVPHKAGSLLEALEPLSIRGINMTRIESRPMRDRHWEYLFYVDIEGHEQDENIHGALMEMENRSSFLKHLGSYPSGGSPVD